MRVIEEVVVIDEVVMLIEDFGTKDHFVRAMDWIFVKGEEPVNINYYHLRVMDEINFNDEEHLVNS